MGNRQEGQSHSLLTTLGVQESKARMNYIMFCERQKAEGEKERQREQQRSKKKGRKETEREGENKRRGRKKTSLLVHVNATINFIIEMYH